MIFNLMDNVRRSKGLELAYTGTMTQSSITVDGAAYTLYTITDSGTLTVKGKGTADIWACGGGANGQLSGSYGAGGGGGYFSQILNQEFAEGNYTVTIGAAQGASSITSGGTTILTAAGTTTQHGASGGGGMSYVFAGYSKTGTGKGKSTIPFGDIINFTLYPCAGGGGSSYRTYETDDYGITRFTSGEGGTGGSNGANGEDGEVATNSSNVMYIADGGATGGGKGCNPSSVSTTYAPTSATYYGSGGGGGRMYITSSNIIYGYGYQGVMYIRVPA